MCRVIGSGNGNGIFDLVSELKYNVDGDTLFFFQSHPSLCYVEECYGTENVMDMRIPVGLFKTQARSTKPATLVSSLARKLSQGLHGYGRCDYSMTSMNLG